MYHCDSGSISTCPIRILYSILYYVPQTLLLCNQHNTLPIVLPLLDVPNRLPGILQSIRDMGLMRDLTRRHAFRHLLVERCGVCGVDPGDEESVETQFAADEVVQVLDPVRFAVVCGDGAAALKRRIVSVISL